MAAKHIWFWRARLGERKGQPCRVVARAGSGRAAVAQQHPALVGAMPSPFRSGSILVEFQDGHRVVTSRHAVRKARA